MAEIINVEERNIEQNNELENIIRQFQYDLGLLKNEQNFIKGMEYWRKLFTNESIIEMNDRIFAGLSEINFWINSHLYNFRRIQMETTPLDAMVMGRTDGGIYIDLGEETTTTTTTSGSNTNTNTNSNTYQYNNNNKGEFVTAQINNYKVLSTTLYATYVPKDPLGCVSIMRWLSIIWYGNVEHIAGHGKRYKIYKWLMTSDKSLIEWEEELTCNWVADSNVLRTNLKKLLDGMYRDADITTMVKQYYDIKAEMNIESEALRGYEDIIGWYQQWQKWGVSVVYNKIEQMDIIGNTVVVKVLTIIVDSSGICSNNYLWYGLYRFNGHGLIVTEQRFYASEQIKEAIQIISNCGDLSPQKTHSTRTSYKKDL